MNQRIRWLLVSIALAFAGAVLLLPHLAYGQLDNQGAAIGANVQSKMDADLVAAIKVEQPETSLRYILFFDEKASLEPQSLPGNESERRQEIVSRLRESADQSQASVQSELLKLQASGQVSQFQQLWIVNGIAVRGTGSSVSKLASHPDVDRVQLDDGRPYFDPPYTLDSAENREGIGGSAWGIEQIQANKVWEMLRIRGEGITVAIVDSGVSLEHPDLYNNYRGNKGDGELEYEKHWLHTELLTSTQPFDILGHGTHVAGTAVGGNGIGIAPGASWIAVAIADEYGLIYDSNIHAAFQWLLAPGGDSKAAPDIANNSWGGAGNRAKFIEDVHILHQAGIITVFAAGNSGPNPGTVLAPGSYPDTIAVGASDNLDQPAWFSGRGPSPLTDEIKPLLLAPGTQILSSLPGNSYGAKNGTSMATPHLAGTIALLLAAEPGLSLPQVREVLTQTAVPIAASHPNHDSGWGRVDAYTAVLSQLPHGSLRGRFTHNGNPLTDVRITVSGTGGFELTGLSDANGRYKLLLPPGTYDVHFNAFGFHEQHLTGININEGQDFLAEATLQQRPMGLLSGTISNIKGETLNAEITILDTPKHISTGADGRFSFWFPIGSYELLVQAVGQRAKRVPLKIEMNKELKINLTLEDGPSILLIDSGPVRYDSALPTYQEALVDSGYSSDLWSLDHPEATLPGDHKLAAYDVLIWSAPSNSPGQLSASEVLTNYLGSGGSLLISGQDVARLDGPPGFEQPWFRHNLQGEYTGEIELAETNPLIIGIEGSNFAGLELRLNGKNSAAYQEKPDHMAPREDSLTRPLLQYAGGAAAGLEAGYCEPFRIIQLGFGLEGVDGAETRTAVLERSIEALQAPRVPLGLRWLPEQQQEITLPGEKYFYELTLQNMSELMTDTFALQVEPYQWATSLVTPTLELGPCAVGQSMIAVEVPADADLDTANELRITAVSQTNSGIRATFFLEQKTPGEILLVDDDRFFEREHIYEEALDNLGYRYDLWDTTPNDHERGGPTAKFLKAYETVLWFTGYDWFSPIHPAENAALTEYLQNDGRLFLSSQDYLFYNWNTPLTRDHFGVLDYRELVTPTVVFANPDLALPSNLAGPVPLTYEPYQNFSDGIILQTGSVPFVWQDTGLAGAVANAGADGGRAVFWSLPLETLPAKEQQAALDEVMGWLSNLGESTFTVDNRYAQAGESSTYTLTLRNLPQAPTVTLAISNTLPQGMALVLGSLPEDIQISPVDNTISWEGMLAPGEERVIHYQTTIAANVPAGTMLKNKITILNLDNHHAYRKSLPLWISTPDLSQSTLSSVATTGLPERSVTYTMAIRNTALSMAEEITAVLKLPDSLHVLTNTLHTSGGEATLVDQQLVWKGSLQGAGVVTSTVVLTQAVLSESWLPAAAIIEDGLRDPILLHDLRYSPPQQIFFPIFATP